MDPQLSGALIKIVASDYPVVKRTRKLLEDESSRGNIGSSFITQSFEKETEFLFSAIIHSKYETIDNMWLIINIPDYQSYDFESIFDLIESIELSTDTILDRISGKLIETQLLLNDPIAYKTYSHGHDGQIRIPIPFGGQMEKLNMIHPICLNDVITNTKYKITVTLSDPSKWPLKMIKNLNSYHSDTNNLISILPKYIIDQHIASYMKIEFAGKLELLSKQIFLDTPKRRVLAQDGFHSEILHSQLHEYTMIDGCVDETRIPNWSGIPKKIIIKVEANDGKESFQFEDLDRIDIYANGHHMDKTTPMITQINHIEEKLNIVSDTIPIYTILYGDEEIFSFDRIDYISFKLLSNKSNLSGKVFVWIMTKKVIVGKNSQIYIDPLQ